ncbi:MAG TPA: hypothetical protein VN721_03615 [Flavipsychrobacter sp.]|nr:hypothetical protein [Flavipsychrobacter sp.]
MSFPLEYYDQQKKHFNSLLDSLNKNYNRISAFRLCSAIVAIIVIICAFKSGESWLWWLLGGMVVLFLVLVRIHTRLTNELQLARVNISILDNELQALEGNYTAFPDGAKYIDIAHPYSYDLDIYGKGSIYQMLCRTVTQSGMALLANILSKPILDKGIIAERQTIIKELSQMPDFLQQFRVAGSIAKEDSGDQNRLTQWLQGNAMFINNTIVRFAIFLMPVLSVASIIWSIYTESITIGLTAVVLINWTLLGNFQKNIKLAVQQIGNTASLIDKYEDLLAQIAAHNFEKDWLSKISLDARKSLKSITQFKKLVKLFDSRGNGLVWPVMNTFFLFDFYCLFRLELWRQKNRSLLLAAIDTVIVMDVYISCAVEAFNHPDNIYPEITPELRGIQAVDLRHPLLSKNAVGNDFSLGQQEQFYLLTGANMTGKSTFMRTIGVSIVLCNIGIPLSAKKLSLPLLQLYTAMRITDSVQEDISYFRAELNRIKMIIDNVKDTKQNCLVLLDEPLRGTNSTDKQQGTRSILETLLACDGRGIVATHDTGLCDLETNYPGKVRNYHFESAINSQGLVFDYKLKPGCSTSNNATLLMRQMGIIN